ncbi:MAG: transposase, partial [Planctomycetia bacterium]
MLARENSGFSVDASVRITLIDRDVPSYFQSLEHLLRYCARPPFALERLSVMRGEDGRIACVRYVLPRRWVTIWAANWVGPGRGRKSTRPGASGVVELSPFEFLDRLADLVPPPRKHRH